MSAALGDPYLLTTYGSPSVSRKGIEKETIRDARPFVFASHCAVPKRDEGHLTLAVQGDGMHVFELGDLHPISSRTLGPSTRFASAPATIICTESDESTRRTYIAVQSSNVVKGEDVGCVIWAWKEQASGDTGLSQDKQSATLGHNVTHLFALQDLNAIVAVSGNGQFSLLDLDLNVRKTWSPKDATQKAKKLFTFSRQHCRFLPQTAPRNACVLIMFVQRDDKLLLQIIAFGLEGEMAALDPLDVLSEELGEIIDISCDSSGNLSVLGSNGTWTHHLLDIKNGLTTVSPGSAPLHLKALNASETRRTLPNQVSLLSLGSSFVLLAGTTSKEIALLLWDVQYGVLLHSYALPTPTALQRSSHEFSLRLSKGSASQAVLILSPISAVFKLNDQSRTCVLIVPFSVPKVSTIAGALGRAAQSAPWLAADLSRSMPADADLYGREAMLISLQEALEERKIKVAEDIFFDWLKNPGGSVLGEGSITSAADRTNASERRQTDYGSIEPKSSSALTIRDDDETEIRDVQMTEGEAPKTHEIKKPIPIRHLLSHSFVTRLLSMMLDLDDPHGKPCPQRICRYLVTRDLVSHSMVKGGLLWALMQYRDWETIRECFLHVVDLPESDLMRVLLFVVRHQRTQSAKEKDAMEVNDGRKKRKSRMTDQWYGVPTPNSFFAHVVDYPTSPAASRAALREYFADVDELMYLLEIAEGWLRMFIDNELSLVPFESMISERAVPVLTSTKSKESSRVKTGSLPSLENLLTFVQIILDSSFITLLQNPASHALLQSIAENITPILQENLELEGLRGPLDPFARAQSRAVAETANGGKKRDEVDWRKRRKQMHEQASINLGPYQVEELVF